MLTLARKVNEAIIVNDNIEITILDVKGDQIKDRRTKECAHLPQGTI